MMARGSSTHHCRRTLSCSSLVPNCSPRWKSPSITALSKRLYVHACTVSRCSDDDGEGKGSSESNSVAASTTLLRCLLTHLAVSRSWAGSEFPIFFLGITSPYTLGTNQHVCCWKSPLITALSRNTCTSHSSLHRFLKAKAVLSSSNEIGARLSWLPIECKVPHIEMISRTHSQGALRCSDDDGKGIQHTPLQKNTILLVVGSELLTLLEISFNHSAQQAPIRACMYGLEVFRRRWRGQRLE